MPLLLWSGGCDSTHLLFTALRDHQTNSEAQPPNPDTPSTVVRTITIVHPNVAAHNEQRYARQQIRDVLHKRGFDWSHLEVAVTHHTPLLSHMRTARKKSKIVSNQTGCDFEANNAGDLGGIIQPLLWVPLAIPYLNTDEDLSVGYISGDDAQYYITTIRAAFDNLQWIAGRIGRLITPLETTSKAEIIHWLKHNKLYRHTWHCEMPRYQPVPKSDTHARGRPCKKCAPCHTHATALWQLATNNCYKARYLKPTIFKKLLKLGVNSPPKQPRPLDPPPRHTPARGTEPKNTKQVPPLNIVPEHLKVEDTP